MSNENPNPNPNPQGQGQQPQQQPKPQQQQQAKPAEKAKPDDGPLEIESTVTKKVVVSDTRAVQQNKSEKAYLVVSGKYSAKDKDGNRILVKEGGRVWAKPETAKNFPDILEEI